jgi:hypothetical protein
MEKRELTMIDELCELESGLAPNELKFVEDLSHKQPGYKLSAAQLEWLEKLWEKYILKAFNKPKW